MSGEIVGLLVMSFLVVIAVLSFIMVYRDYKKNMRRLG